MKIYISADIEGVAGATLWEDTEIGGRDYEYFAKCMTNEVLAAVEAALDMGATEIFINDAHESATNMKYDDFPKEVTYMRGWSRSPEMMVEGMDESFDAAIFIGYHSGSGQQGSPLAHTMEPHRVIYYKINGQLVDEFYINAVTLGSKGIPVAFVSGDEAMCQYIESVNEHIETAAVKKGYGRGTINVTPKHSCELIRSGVKAGLAKKEKCVVPEQENYEVEIYFSTAWEARRNAFYPGAELVDTHVVRFVGKTIEEVNRFNLFVL